MLPTCVEDAMRFVCFFCFLHSEREGNAAPVFEFCQYSVWGVVFQGNLKYLRKRATGVCLGTAECLCTHVGSGDAVPL